MTSATYLRIFGRPELVGPSGEPLPFRTRKQPAPARGPRIGLPPASDGPRRARGDALARRVVGTRSSFPFAGKICWPTTCPPQQRVFRDDGFFAVMAATWPMGKRIRPSVGFPKLAPQPFVWAPFFHDHPTRAIIHMKNRSSAEEMVPILRREIPVRPGEVPPTPAQTYKDAIRGLFMGREIAPRSSSGGVPGQPDALSPGRAVRARGGIAGGVTRLGSAAAPSGQPGHGGVFSCPQ